MLYRSLLTIMLIAFAFSIKTMQNNKPLVELPTINRSFFQLQQDAPTPEYLCALQRYAADLRFQNNRVRFLEQIIPLKNLIDQKLQDASARFLSLMQGFEQSIAPLMMRLNMLPEEDARVYGPIINTIQQSVAIIAQDFSAFIRSGNKVNDFVDLVLNAQDQRPTYLTMFSEISFGSTHIKVLYMADNAFWENTINIMKLASSCCNDYQKDVDTAVKCLPEFTNIAIDTAFLSRYTELSPLYNIIKIDKYIQDHNISAIGEYTAIFDRIAGIGISIVHQYHEKYEQTMQMYERAFSILYQESLAFAHQAHKRDMVAHYLKDIYLSDRLPNTIRHIQKSATAQQQTSPKRTDKKEILQPRQRHSKQKKGTKKHRNTTVLKECSVALCMPEPEIIATASEAAQVQETCCASEEASQNMQELTQSKSNTSTPKKNTQYSTTKTIRKQGSKNKSKKILKTPPQATPLCSRTCSQTTTSYAQTVAAECMQGDQTSLIATNQTCEANNNCLALAYTNLLRNILQLLQLQHDRCGRFTNYCTSSNKGDLDQLMQQVAVDGYDKQELIEHHACLKHLLFLKNLAQRYQSITLTSATREEAQQYLLSKDHLFEFKQNQSQLLFLMQAMTRDIGQQNMREKFFTEYNHFHSWIEEGQNFSIIHDLDNNLLLGIAKHEIQREKHHIVSLLPLVDSVSCTKEMWKWFFNAREIIQQKGYQNHILETQRHRFCRIVDSFLPTLGVEYIVVENQAQKRIVQQPITSLYEKQQIIDQFIHTGCKIYTMIRFEGYVEFTSTGTRIPCFFEYLYDAVDFPQWFHREIRLINS